MEKNFYEVLLWLLIWTCETLFIKYYLGVESWLISVILAVTVGSFCVLAVKHLPDIFD